MTKNRGGNNGNEKLIEKTPRQKKTLPQTSSYRNSDSVHHNQLNANYVFSALVWNSVQLQRKNPVPDRAGHCQVLTSRDVPAAHVSGLVKHAPNFHIS